MQLNEEDSHSALSDPGPSTQTFTSCFFLTSCISHPFSLYEERDTHTHRKWFLQHPAYMFTTQSLLHTPLTAKLCDWTCVNAWRMAWAPQVSPDNLFWVYVCVCVRERERERERDCTVEEFARLCDREHECAFMCVCVCVCLQERKRKCMCVIELESEWAREHVITCVSCAEIKTGMPFSPSVSFTNKELKCEATVKPATLFN